jgi:hypothetical protein
MLNRCIQLAPHLTPKSPHAAPTLWHEDISWQNILVSEKGPPEVLSVIDWQHSRVVPLYLYCHQPHFLDSTTDPLPDDEDKAAHLNDPRLVEQEREDLRNHFALAVVRGARHAAQAFGSTPYAKAQASLISNSGRSWPTRKGIYFLRQNLLKIIDNWHQYQLPGNPPVSFTEEERRLHKNESKGLEKQFQFIIAIMKAVGMTETGEVLTHEYEEKRKLYEEYKKHCIDESGIAESVDWEKAWPLRYPDIGF